MTTVGISDDLEKEFADFARQCATLLDPADVRIVLEIGSRDGLVSMLMRRFFPNAAVYAFECNPAAITLIRSNISNTSGISLVERAVSDTNGRLPFFAIDPARTITPHADGNIGASSLYRARDDYPYEQYVQQEIEVESTRLDTWATAANVDAIDVVWMDIQGAELRALEGLGSLLRHIQVIYTEVEYKAIYEGQALAPELRRFLFKHGFRFHSRLWSCDWFGNELYCRADLLPFRKRALARWHPERPIYRSPT